MQQLFFGRQGNHCDSLSSALHVFLLHDGIPSRRFPCILDHITLQGLGDDFHTLGKPALNAGIMDMGCSDSHIASLLLAIYALGASDGLY